MKIRDSGWTVVTGEETATKGEWGSEEDDFSWGNPQALCSPSALPLLSPNPWLLLCLYGQLPLKSVPLYLNACLAPPLSCPKCAPNLARLHLPKTQSPSSVPILMDSGTPHPSLG